MRASAAALALLLLAGCAGGPPRRQGFGPPGGAPGRGDRPPRARGGFGGGLFISPMGEPFRGEGGGPSPAAAWFAGADANGDGRITRAEMAADAARFFATLDVDGDGEVGPAEIDRYEEVVAPEIRTGGGSFGGGAPGGARQGGGRGGRGGGGGMGGGRGGGGGMPGGGGGGGGMGGGRGGGRGGGGGEGAPASPDGGEPARQGAARFGYLALPEPVVAADADLNRGVSRAEFAHAADARFLLLDANRDGVLTADELPRLGGPPR